MKALDRMIKDRAEGKSHKEADMAEHLFEDCSQDMLMLNNNGMVFFKPDRAFVNWIGTYANGRLITEVGCGTAHLLRMLRSAGFTKIFGIEPVWDYMAATRSAMEAGQDILQVMPWTVERASKMLYQLTEKETKSLILICRPSHGDYPEQTIDAVASGTEILYITKDYNLQDHEDLGKYQHLIEIIPHEGKSEDGEIVCRVIKP